MSRLKWCGPPVVAACLLVLALTGTFWAQDKKPLAEKHDAAALRDSLKNVINTGAELFNKLGDHAGCYRLYQGALLSVKPFLAPGMQKDIDQALAEAEKMPRFSDRAFALRKTIDDIRGQAKPAPTPPIIDLVPDDKAPAKTTLWDRLGGEANVRKVVDDFVKAAANDPKVNVTRDGKFKLDEAAVQNLANHLVEFVSSATGGPLKYAGKTMKEAHKGMGITNGEFDAAGKHLKKALQDHGAKSADVAELIKIVESVRKDIVEGRKPPKKEAPKNDEKKDEPNKNNETAKISGRATLDGQPLDSAYITLVSADKRRFSTSIKDGVYVFKTPIPLGAYLVLIEHPFGQKIPDSDPLVRYSNEDTAVLTFDVRTGPNEFSLDLKK